MIPRFLFRNLLVIAFVTTAGAGAPAALTLQSDAMSVMNWLPIAKRAQAVDVSVQFSSSTFSLSRSTFDVHVSSSLPPPANGSLPVVLDPASILVSGVQDVRPVRLVGTSRLAPQTVAFHLEAGPPEAGVGAVELTIGVVFLVSDGQARVVRGPWSYEAPVDQAALAADSRVVGINQPVSVNGLLVNVSEARLTKDEVLVRYTLTAPEGYVGPIGPPAQMRLASGEVIRGIAVGPTRGRTGDLAVSFPPVPVGTSTFDIEFGPYAIAEGGVAVGVDIPPESPVLSGTGSITIDKAVHTPAGDIALDALRTTADGFVLEFSGAAGVASRASFSPDAVLTLTPRVGGEGYRPRSLGVRFARGVDGTLSFKSAVAEFRKPLSPAWAHFDLVIDRVWREIALPWPVTVTVE